MSYDSMEVETGGGKFLKIEAGKSVDVNILTKSDDMVLEKVHWTGSSYAPCIGKDCPECSSGNKPIQRFRVNVLDRADNTVKIYEFGVNVAIGIKEVAKVLRLDDMTIHDVDLRIVRVSENPVRYQVIQRKKAGEIPADIKVHDLKKKDAEETVPF